MTTNGIALGEREVSISLGADGNLILGIPSPEIIHHLEVPCTEQGLRLIRKVLSARKRHGRTKISQEGNPTQWQVNAWLRAERAEAAREAKARQAEAMLEGLDLMELDL